MSRDFFSLQLNIFFAKYSMLPQLIFIDLVSVRLYSWSKNELKMFIEKINIPVLAPIINNA